MFQIPGLSMFDSSGARGAVNANRLAVNSSYQWMQTVQGHLEKVTDMWWQHSMQGSQNLRKAQSDWLALMQKERESLKQTVDLGFQAMAEFWAPRQSTDSGKNSSEQKASAKQAQEPQGKKSTGKAQEGSGKKTAAKSQESTAKSQAGAGEKASAQSQAGSGENAGAKTQDSAKEPAKKESAAATSSSKK